MDILGRTSILNLSYLLLPVYANHMTGEAAYYNQGLKDILSNNPGSTITNSAFGLSLGYRIHFNTTEKRAQ